MRNKKPTSETAGPLWPLVPGDIPTVNFHHYLSLTYPQYIANYEYNVMSEWGRRILVRSWQAVRRPPRSFFSRASNRRCKVQPQPGFAGRPRCLRGEPSGRAGRHPAQPGDPRGQKLSTSWGQTASGWSPEATSCPPPHSVPFLRPHLPWKTHPPIPLLSGLRPSIHPQNFACHKKHMCNHCRFPNCWIFHRNRKLWNPPSTNPCTQVYRTEIHGCVSPIWDVLLSTAYTTDKKPFTLKHMAKWILGSLFFFNKLIC